MSVFRPNVCLQIGVSVTIACLIFSTNFYTQSFFDNPRAGISSSQSDVSLFIYVLDVNEKEAFIDISIHLEVSNFPHNASFLILWIVGGSDGYSSAARIVCTRSELSRTYVGNNRTVWRIYGNGEAFPFDSYEAKFEIAPYFSYGADNRTVEVFQELDPDAYGNFFIWQKVWFTGEYEDLLISTWKTGENAEVPSEKTNSQEVIVRLERIPEKYFLQFVLPIVACYFLLGSSVLIRRKKDYIHKRLRVYLPMFFFAPSFFFAIQNFLPHRSSLSLPEALLTNLVISCAVFAFFSMVPSESRLWDFLTVGLSVVIFLWLYISGFLKGLSILTHICLLATILLGYVSGLICTILFKSHTK